jgi:tetratricopeptide (TPR) repeat protein
VHRHAAWSKDVEANEAYLRGKYYLDRATLDGLRLAFQHVSSAVQKDPTHGRAFAALAEWYVCAAPFRLVTRSEALPKSREAALHAITLDPTLDEAHTCLGLIALLEWDVQRAKQEFEEALRLNPNAVNAGRRLAHVLSLLGRHKDAIALIEQIRELDPISPRTNLAVASVYYIAGRYDAAIEPAQAALDLEPGSEPAQYFMGMARHFAGQAELAIRHLTQASADCPALLSGLAFVLARTGDSTAARRVIDDMKDRATTQEELLSAYDFAEAFSGLGDDDRTLTYLQRACDLRLPEMLGVAADPAFQTLRDHPRFRRIVRTVGLDV